MEKSQTRNHTIKERERDFLLLLGYNYLKSRKIKNSIVIYKALYHLYPKSAILSLCLSFLYLQIRQYEEALFYAEIYITNKKGKHKQGRLIKSKALFELGLVEEAKECAQKILAK